MTFTACTSHTGSLLLGSSRRDGVDGGAPDAATVDAILREGAAWLPCLEAFLGERRGEVSVRVGPRPASKRGKPYIGVVPGLSGLVLAAGHEGSGLTMALATAEIVSSCLELSAAPKLAPCFRMCVRAWGCLLYTSPSPRDS